MSEGLTITTEQVDDFPVLIAQMKRTAIPDLLDRQFPVHGNWQGLSLGWTATGWLGHILSVGDHRLNHVQGWVERNPQTVQRSIGQAVSGLDFSDDRLEGVLDALGEDENWTAFEGELNQRTLRVYDLKAELVRVDSTTASGYVSVTEDGLFQFGHSKDHRPDLPQVKVMQSTLDPFGMPLVTQVVSGEKADDRLYLPAIQQVRQGLKKRGVLYVGDCKLMSLDNRAYIQAGGDYYLGPFSKVQFSDEALETQLQAVWSGQQALRPIYRMNTEGEEEQIAEGFERAESLSATQDGQEVTWSERRLFIRSFQIAKAAESALRERLDKAQAALEALNERKQGKTHFTEIEVLRQAAEDILRQYRVEGLLSLSFIQQMQERQVRKYGDHPAEVRIEREVSLTLSRNEPAIQQSITQLGWRVYGTNASQDDLPLAKAVLAYRNEYLVERGFARLKGRTLSLTPMFLKDDQRVTGLIRLLSIGLRVLTLLEFVVRRGLAQNQEQLAGLYAGNPKRTTATPRAETLLEAFKNIYLSTVTIEEQILLHITPLSELQRKILCLLGLSPNIYSQLAADSLKPP
jgi:transposase